MKLRKIIYGLITIVCVLSLGVGIYYQFTQGKKNTNSQASNATVNEISNSVTQEKLKKEFYNIFDNNFHIDNYNTTSINKTDNTKEIVYTFYSSTEKSEAYDIDINLPIININNEEGSKFNSITQEKFANKANEILSGKDDGAIYTVTYTGYINGDIMSVIIKATLKEKTSAQRVMIQTYNYNLSTGVETTIEDAIEQRGTDTTDVSKKINTQIKAAIKEANDIQVTGYEVFARNIDDKMYKLENTTTFFLSEDGTLYIIYAYGNEENTSEMDIIVI